MAMEDSILKSTKKVLGVDPAYPAFDLDILTHINSTFVIVVELGVGPDEGITVDDEAKTWTELGLPPKQLNLLKSYVYLRVRMLFDPPATSFLIEAVNKQIQELEQRLSFERESLLPAPIVEVVDDDDADDYANEEVIGL